MPNPADWRERALGLRAEGVEAAKAATQVGAPAADVQALFARQGALDERLRGLRADLAHYSRLALKAETGEKPDVKTALKAREKATHLREQIADAEGAYDPDAPRRKIAAAQPARRGVTA